jgi:hypothetical protein
MALATYRGSCQCGAVRFSAELDLTETITCNCSRCRRLGAILTFVKGDKFRLEAGEGAMTEYRFNKHVIHHMFCSTCGIQPFSHAQTPDGPGHAVNVRCLEGVDPDELTPQRFDGLHHL